MSLKNRIGRNFFLNEIRTLFNWKSLKPVNRWQHGHFYSSIVSKVDLEQFESDIWPEQIGPELPGIDLNTEHQVALLKSFSDYYKELPFSERSNPNTRYHYDNSSFRYFDAIILYSFIRHFKPKRIIEIGSGFTSAIMLDTRELSGLNIDLTFIEPYPALLQSLLRGNDKFTCRIINEKVQAVSLEVFRTLEEGDILFIDSSHVSKTGSDVNYELFSILPSLADGVIIHFHDIFYPFEYPKSWVYEGRNWNEDYLLRAFLNYNSTFRIEFFVDFISKFHMESCQSMPLTLKENGGSLWLRKGETKPL